jgi:hypothetical protein
VAVGSFKAGGGQSGKQLCRANTKDLGLCGFAFILNCVPMGVCQVSEGYSVCEDAEDSGLGETMGSSFRLQQQQHNSLMSRILGCDVTSTSLS